MRVTFTLIVTLIVALIAEMSMNKGIQTNYESMRAKSLLNFFWFNMLKCSYPKINDSGNVKRMDYQPIESEPNFLPMSCIAEFNMSSSDSLRQ